MTDDCECQEVVELVAGVLVLHEFFELVEGVEGGLPVRFLEGVFKIRFDHTRSKAFGKFVVNFGDFFQAILTLIVEIVKMEDAIIQLFTKLLVLLFERQSLYIFFEPKLRSIFEDGP